MRHLQYHNHHNLNASRDEVVKLSIIVSDLLEELRIAAASMDNKKQFNIQYV